MTASEERGIQLATEALQAAMGEDSLRASAAVRAINGELGGEGLTLAIYAWCDTLIHRYREAAGVPGDGPVRMAWQEVETGDISATGNDVPPETRWAGRVIEARSALDKAAFDACIAALPDDGWAIGGYVSALLSTVALTLSRLAGSRPAR
jgi:hypothetical protein